MEYKKNLEVLNWARMLFIRLKEYEVKAIIKLKLSLVTNIIPNMSSFVNLETY